MSDFHGIIHRMIQADISRFDEKVEEQKKARRNLFGEPVKVDEALAARLAKEQMLLDPDAPMQITKKEETANETGEPSRTAFPRPEI